YFRWLHDNYDLVDPYGTFNASALPTTPTARNRPGYGPQVGHLWTISPHVINEAKLNASWNGQRTPLEGDAWQRSKYGFQFPLLYGGNGPYPTGIPDVTINGFTGYRGPARVYLLSPTTDISFSDSLTYVQGAHTTKFGVIVIRNRKDQNGRTTYDGNVNFNTNPNTNTSGYALADAVLGNFSTYDEAASDPVGFFRFTQIESFVQHDRRVARNLTLNIGLRFAHFIPTYTQGNNIVNFDPSLYDPAQAVSVTSKGLIVPNSGNIYNGLIRAGGGVPKDQSGRVANADSPDVLAVRAGAPRGLYPVYNLWMPRFGFAWAVNDKTSLRGGFGSFHDRVQGNIIFSQLNSPPFSTSMSYESGNLGNPAGGTIAARAVLGGINAIDRNLKVPVVYHYNLNLERQLPRGLFIRLAYAGNVQHHLLRQPDINFPSFETLAANYAIPSSQRPVTNAIRPYKGFSTIRMFLSDANANYNSMQAFVSKRKGSSIFTASYTWSHTLADTSGDTDNQDSGIGYTNRHFFYGPPSFDRRHVLVVTYTYRMPSFGHRGGFLKGAFGGWEVSGVTRAQSGPHLTPTGSSTGVTRRADYLGLPVALPSDERTPNQWFNTAAFRAASSTALGNAGVGTIVGPGLYTWDVTLRKVFSIPDTSWKLRFEANAFNLMNHANFRSLSTSTSSQDYGSFTSAGPARQIQGGIKLTF
ncbi:MAG: carboxypeptidase regulatory-like domain-containing protein, partial [Acidobacteria bacterium]|nr:carboxypeptidase regulatory-like domain-containing protein [Acidobacteriota bacterium]